MPNSIESHLDSIEEGVMNAFMARPVIAEPTRHLFTTTEYHQMGDAGIFTEDDRVELIEGEIIHMSPIGTSHTSRVKRLLRLLVRGLGDRAIVQIQDPIVIDSYSEPEPDVAILRPRPDFYAARHPQPADVFLLVEVAGSSRKFDRDIKVPLYARARIPEVWVVDVIDEHVEVYRQPSRGAYRQTETLHRGNRVRIGAFPGLSFRITDILG